MDQVVSKKEDKFILQLIHYNNKRGCVFFSSYHDHLKNPAIATKISSTSELSDRAVIKWIKIDYDNKTKVFFNKSRQKYWDRDVSLEYE